MCNKFHEVGLFAEQCRTKRSCMNELTQNHSALKDDYSQLYSVTAMRGFGQATKVRMRVQGQNGLAELSVY